MKIEIESKVVNHKLEKNRELLSEVIKNLEGKDIIITIEKKRKKRSNPQNAYYFGVVIPLMKQGFYN
jgi:aromatic ring-opening dioxygenase LigB subunit